MAPVDGTVKAAAIGRNCAPARKPVGRYRDRPVLQVAQNMVRAKAGSHFRTRGRDEKCHRPGLVHPDGSGKHRQCGQHDGAKGTSDDQEMESSARAAFGLFQRIFFRRSHWRVTAARFRREFASDPAWGSAIRPRVRRHDDTCDRRASAGAARVGRAHGFRLSGLSWPLCNLRRACGFIAERLECRHRARCPT